MGNISPRIKTLALIATTAMLPTCYMAGAASAQQLSEVIQPADPLILKSRGLIIGGDRIAQTRGQLSSIIAAPPAEAGQSCHHQPDVRRVHGALEDRWATPRIGSRRDIERQNLRYDPRWTDGLV